MFRLLLISVLLTFKLCSWSQDNQIDIYRYLSGDWYFFDKGDSNCSFNSSYNEIVFFDSSYSICGDCDYNMVQIDFLIDGNNLVFPSIGDEDDEVFGVISIIDSNTFILNLDDGQLRLKRLVIAKYTLSDYIHDITALNSLDLKMPGYLFQEMKYSNLGYYNVRLYLRGLWKRLELKEINKDLVLNRVDDRIDDSDSFTEVRELRVFRDMVDNIFD